MNQTNDTYNAERDRAIESMKPCVHVMSEKFLDGMTGNQFLQRSCDALYALKMVNDLTELYNAAADAVEVEPLPRVEESVHVAVDFGKEAYAVFKIEMLGFLTAEQLEDRGMRVNRYEDDGPAEEAACAAIVDSIPLG